MEERTFPLLVIATVFFVGCTDLRVVNRSHNPNLPWYEDAPRWESTGYSATAHFNDDRLSISSSIPHTVSDCVNLSLGKTVCEDLDEDGLVDEWETIVSHRLNPVIRYHPDDPLFTDKHGRVQAFSRVTPAPGQPDRIHVFILHTYSFDYGRCSLERHHGDLERVVIELSVLETKPASITRVEAVYLAAHEHTSFDVSATYHGDDLAALEYSTDPITKQPRWVIYASAGKHASYISRAKCTGRSTLFCARESCASAADAYELLIPVVHVGEPSATDFVWWSTGSPNWWSSFDSIWGGGEFCGGVTENGYGCIVSIRKKLTMNPFSSP